MAIDAEPPFPQAKILARRSWAALRSAPAAEIWALSTDADGQGELGGVGAAEGAAVRVLVRRERRPRPGTCSLAVVEDVPDGGGEVGEGQDVVAREGDRPHVQRPGADGPGQPDVGRAVADDPGGSEIEPEGLRGGERHARSGLAVGARSRERLDDAVGVIGAEQPEVDVRALPRHLLDHVLVDLVDVLDAVVAAGHAGLVRHDGHRHAGAVQLGDGLDGALEELDAVDRADIAAVGDDRAVTVQQHSRPAHRRRDLGGIGVGSRRHFRQPSLLSGRMAGMSGDRCVHSRAPNHSPSIGSITASSGGSPSLPLTPATGSGQGMASSGSS